MVVGRAFVKRRQSLAPAAQNSHASRRLQTLQDANVANAGAQLDFRSAVIHAARRASEAVHRAASVSASSTCATSSLTSPAEDERDFSPARRRVPEGGSSWRRGWSTLMNRLPQSSSTYGYRILKQTSDDLASDTQQYPHNRRHQPQRYATIDAPATYSPSATTYVNDCSQYNEHRIISSHNGLNVTHDAASGRTYVSPQRPPQRSCRMLPQPLLYEGDSIIRRLPHTAQSLDSAVPQSAETIQTMPQTRQRRLLPNGLPKGDTIDGCLLSEWDAVVDVSDHKTCALLMTRMKESNRNQSSPQ